MADDVQVVNRRFDASENDALIGMARMGADAVAYTADLQIDRTNAVALSRSPFHIGTTQPASRVQSPEPHRT